MKLAAILPTVKLWGGVKRFCEVGNCLVRRGHAFTLISPEGAAPAWFPFLGDAQRIVDIDKSEFDAVFCTEPAFLPQLLACQCRLRIFYHVLQSEDLGPVLRCPGIRVFVNSINLYEFDRRRYGISPFLAVGGVDTKRFSPVAHEAGGRITVLAYGRLSAKRKGTRFVVRACERLYRKGHDIRLLLFDTPLDKKDLALAQAFRPRLPFEFVLNHPVERTNEIYNRADIFASAEKNAGWANTCAEAMACGLPVVATASGSRDFLVNGETGLVVRRNSWSVERGLSRLIADSALRAALGRAGRAAIEKYDWENLAAHILDNLHECLA